MRISDWSSDVCSSDLAFRKRDADGDLPVGQREFRAILVDLAKRRDADRLAESLGGDAKLRGEREARANDDLGTLKIALDARRADFLNLGHFGKQPVADIFELLRVVAAERRSEEHTSELQSLMRISYAVFCLKNKYLEKE